MDVFRCRGGAVRLPPVDLVLVDRADGGNLVVNPPRDVWERGELTPSELDAWGRLVAATGRAMLSELPQLEGGCVNYWEAGNWALNDAAAPAGPKRAREHRSVHAHLLGRSPNARSPNWLWGEAPVYPTFAERHAWAAKHARLTPDETRRIVDAVERVLVRDYGFAGADIAGRAECKACSYPFVVGSGSATLCPECAA